MKQVILWVVFRNSFCVTATTSASATGIVIFSPFLNPDFSRVGLTLYNSATETSYCLAIP
jgi:hypothetical protein